MHNSQAVAQLQSTHERAEDVLDLVQGQLWLLAGLHAAQHACHIHGRHKPVVAVQNGDWHKAGMSDSACVPAEWPMLCAQGTYDVHLHRYCMPELSRYKDHEHDRA